MQITVTVTVDDDGYLLLAIPPAALRALEPLPSCGLRWCGKDGRFCGEHNPHWAEDLEGKARKKRKPKEEPPAAAPVQTAPPAAEPAPTRLEDVPYDADGFDVRTCRACGCTDQDCTGCVERTGEPCSWVAEDLCSACVTPEPLPPVAPRQSRKGKQMNAGANQAILDAIYAEPRAPRELAAALGMQIGVIKYRLRHLVAAGSVVALGTTTDRKYSLPVRP